MAVSSGQMLNTGRLFSARKKNSQKLGNDCRSAKNRRDFATSDQVTWNKGLPLETANVDANRIHRLTPPGADEYFSVFTAFLGGSLLHF